MSANPIKKRGSHTDIKRTNENSDLKAHKYTPEIVEILATELRRLATIEQACVEAGINPDTYYTWRKKYPDFALKMARAKNSPQRQAKQTVMDHIDDLETAKWLLAHTANKEFNTRAEVEYSQVEAPIIVDDIPKGKGK